MKKIFETGMLLFAMMGFWGMIYPDLCFTEEVCEVYIMEDDTLCPDANAERADVNVKSVDANVKSMDANAERADASVKRVDANAERTDASVKSANANAERTDASVKSANADITRTDIGTRSAEGVAAHGGKYDVGVESAIIDEVSGILPMDIFTRLCMADSEQIQLKFRFMEVFLTGKQGKSECRQ